MRTTTPFRAAALALALGATLVACGGDDDDPTASTSPSGGTATAALDTLKFDPDELTAEAGPVELTLTNEGNLQHTLVIEDVDDFRLLVASSGESDSDTVELEAGEYTFYCDVAGHRSGGMEGTLTVA